MSIVASLLHANYKENLIIKKLKFVLLTCLLPFLTRPKGLEKKVNQTEVAKTVFSHLRTSVK